MKNMAAAIVATSFLVITSSLMSSSEAGGRTRSGGLSIVKKAKFEGTTIIYWGQNGKEEGSLREICYNLNYGDIVLISGLTRFGFGREPMLNLTDHCDPYDYSGCSFLSRDIRACQREGIKVFLSIGGDYDGENTVYDVVSEEVADELADYLWHNFLGGFSRWRPLGNAVLDGIDFDIEGGGTDSKWEVLADKLSGYNTFFRRVDLSGAVQCQTPDPFLDSSITTGVFDYIWVKFFEDESRGYLDGNIDNLYRRWNAWNSHPGVRKLFVGLPLVGAEILTRISEAELFEEVLPNIAKSVNYGGVMLKVLDRIPDIPGMEGS